MKIAVIGAGISGLGAAWLLSKSHDVTVFEQDARLGGHANTASVDDGAGEVGVDTGFIVYNTKTYPNLTALFAHLDVPTAQSNMSFAVTLDGGNFEYSGSGLTGLFGQPSNLASPRHWRMIWDVLRFFREAKQLKDVSLHGGLSLGDWLRSQGYSTTFVDRHLLPMASAIWSTPTMQVQDFPAVSFVRFFSNHGLLNMSVRPQWRTVAGGSRAYVAALVADTAANFQVGRPVTRIEREAEGVRITVGDMVERFDACVLAGHADQSLDMLADADRSERELLGAFRYSENTAVLHRDASWMPRRHRLWSSWNYGAEASDECTSVTYWMNSLQPLATRENWFVTLNPGREINDDLVARRDVYAHPTFDRRALDAQFRLWGLQGRRRTWFCGSYFGYGFHEDGLQSGLAVAEALGGVMRPWSIPSPSDRLIFSPQIPLVLPEAGASVAA